MKRIHVLLAAIAATASIAASAAPSTTDEARAEAGQRIAAAEHAASLQPFETATGAVSVLDTDTAEWAAQQANTRSAHNAYLADVLRAGKGIARAAIQVTDTDSARAAAGQASREQMLLADYRDYVKQQAQITPARYGASN
jgi:hypothetical protein